MATHIKRFLSTIILFSVSFIYLIPALNSYSLEKNRFSEKWIQTNYYPLTAASPAWNQYGFLEIIDILNPPEELLSSMTTPQLLNLLLDYPLLNIMYTYDLENVDYIFDFLKLNCDIYNELLSRTDGVNELLTRYANNNISVEKLNSITNIAFSNDRIINLEILCCQYVNKYEKKLKSSEKKILSKTKIEKTALYSSIRDNTLSSYLSFGSKRANMRNNLTSTVGNLELNSTSNGWSSAGVAAVSINREGEPIKYTPGSFHKYDVRTDCYKYSSGSLSSSTVKRINNCGGYNWTQFTGPNPKYNCHSYAWIQSNTSNEFWLDSPVAYTLSPSVKNMGRNTTPKVGEIVVMSTTSGEIRHSAVICKAPSGKSGIYTKSKLGARGGYTAPLNELLKYYGCANYDVYHTY